MDRELQTHIKSCMQCRENAPSHPSEPMIATDVPKYPFQKVASDLFQIEGIYYLVYVDRLTGFPELAYFPTSTTSKAIIDSFREFFHRWGVPEEIELDGAPNLFSQKMVSKD